MPYRLIKSIDGRRGAALMTVAFIFLPLSWSQVSAHRSGGRSAALSWLPQWVDHSILGYTLLACSGVAFLIGLLSRAAFRRNPTWRARLIAFGFQLMFIPPGLLAILHGVAWILGLSPLGYVGLFAFGGYALLIYILAGWEEGRRSPPLSREALELILGAPTGPVDQQKKDQQ